MGGGLFLERGLQSEFKKCFKSRTKRVDYSKNVVTLRVF